MTYVPNELHRDALETRLASQLAEAEVTKGQLAALDAATKAETPEPKKPPAKRATHKKADDEEKK